MKHGFLIVIIAVLIFGGCSNYFHELVEPDENKILSFTVPGQTSPAVIAENTVFVMADEYTSIRSLVPVITISPKAELIPLTLEYIQTAFPSAHVSSRAAGMYTRDDFADHLFALIREDKNFNIPDLSVPIDFSEPVGFLVIAEKGDIRRYTVNIVKPMPVTISVINGVTVPVAYEVPVTTVTETAQYTGTVTWSPAVSGTFAGETVYTATITLTPKPGFTLIGVEADFFTVAGAETVSNAANSGVVTAVFPRTDPLFMVTFDTGGGSEVAPQIVLQGDKAEPPAEPNRDGYTFDGWYTDDTTFNDPWDSDQPVIRSFTVYAKWNPITYTITYLDVGGGAFTGTHGTDYPETHTYGTDTTLVSPTRDGYTFDGWFINSNGSGTALTSLAADGYLANITLYAKWTANSVGNNISFADIIDPPESINITLSVSGTDPYSATAEISLDNPGQYTSFEWYYNNELLSSTSSVTLTASGTFDNILGIKLLTVVVEKDGKLYSADITVRVVE